METIEQILARLPAGLALALRSQAEKELREWRVQQANNRRDYYWTGGLS